jgi:hypothetical protein
MSRIWLSSYYETRGGVAGRTIAFDSMPFKCWNTSLPTEDKQGEADNICEPKCPPRS